MFFLRVVGSIVSVQGFEFDRVSVIWGGDLVWRDRRWVAQLERSKDSVFKKELKASGEDSVEKLRNISAFSSPAVCGVPVCTASIPRPDTTSSGWKKRPSEPPSGSHSTRGNWRSTSIRGQNGRTEAPLRSVSCVGPGAVEPESSGFEDDRAYQSRHQPGAIACADGVLLGVEGGRREVLRAVEGELAITTQVA